METKQFDTENIFKDLDEAFRYFYYFDRLSELKSDDVHYIKAFVAYIKYLENLKIK